METSIRPMRADDLTAVDEVWHSAFAALIGDAAAAPRTAEDIATAKARHAHLLTTDPAGSFVALADDRIVGLSQAHRREGTFVLGLLGIHPEFQNVGLGHGLLDAALGYAEGSSVQYVFSSMDPRALHRYVSAGFALRPTVTLTSRRETPSREVVAGADGNEEALAFVSEIDRAVRGAARPSDVSFWLSSGARLLIDERGGYAVVNNARLTTLAARREEIASDLLEQLLDEVPGLEVWWVAAEQQWAIRTASAAGCTLGVRGAVMSRGITALPVPFLPNGLFG